MRWILTCSVHILFFVVVVFLPSHSSIRKERFAFLFRAQGSAKLLSEEPPSQTDGLESLSIFPPHVTLRFGILKTRKVGQQDSDNVEKSFNYSFILCHSYLLNRNLVWAGDKQLGQVFDSVLLFSLQLILFLEQLGENLLLCRCGLCDWRNLQAGHLFISAVVIQLAVTVPNRKGLKKNKEEEEW